MRAVLAKSIADLRHRKLQGAVVALVVLLASLAGAVAIDLLVESDAPFDHAFSQSSGAHLVLHVDSGRTSYQQLQATAALPSVSAAGGPWRELPLELTTTDKPANFLDIVGRADPNGSVDQLQVIDGRWVQRSGEVVLARRAAEELGIAPGATLSVNAAQGVSALQVVGIAAPVFDNADAWATPAQVAALRMPVIPGGVAKGAPPPPAWVMMYRLHDAATAAAISTASNQIAHHLPADSIVDASNWLTQRASADITTSVMIPFLLAFSLFALAAAAVIIGNVVSGAVIAVYREVGVTKAIGFTPLQVLTSLALQMLIPAGVGAGAGVAAGLLVSQPFLAQTADAFDLPVPSPFIPWVIALCIGTALAIALAATLVPGLRAARLSAAEAITSGSGPTTGRGQRLRRLLSGLPLPRTATLGIADAAARPVRSAMTLIAVVLGVATITFAAGLTSSLADVKSALVRDQQVQVVVQRGGGGFEGPAMDDRTLSSLIQEQSGTRRFVAETSTPAHIPGVSQPISVYGYRGDASWIGYVVISGRWFHGAAEAVAPTALLDAAGLHVGDSVQLSQAGRRMTVRIVGEIFDQQGDNLLLRTDWSTLTAVAPGAQPRSYEVAVGGTDPRRYAQGLESAVAGAPVGVEVNGGRGYDVPFLLITSAVAGLALVLTLCALAGVFNTVVLTTREKARDTAILKSLGMTRRQVVSMVLTSVGVIAVLAVAAGIPAGMLLHHQILVTMGRIATGTAIPPSFFAVFPASLIAMLALVGMAVALVAAWVPAHWAARSRIGDLLAPE